MIGFLILLGGVTVGLSLLARNDGADHPVTTASVAVALALVSGGPRFVAVGQAGLGRHANA